MAMYWIPSYIYLICMLKNGHKVNIIYHGTIRYVYGTVDGRNPAPPGMYETLKIMVSTTNLTWLAGLLQSTVYTYIFS